MCFVTCPHTGRSRDVKSGDRGGHAIIPPRPIQATICRVTRGNHTEQLSVSVDVHVLKFVKYVIMLCVFYFLRYYTFCVTDLGTPCIIMLCL